TTYFQTAELVDEPVLKQIAMNLAKDEMRHSVGFENYARQCILNSEDPDLERITCLRATWAFLQDEGMISHPVFITVQNLGSLIGEESLKKIRRQVTSRIGKLVGIEIPDPDKIFEVYSDFKKQYRQRKAA